MEETACRKARGDRAERGSGLGPFEPPLAGINGAILRFIACHRLRRTQVRLHPMPALAPRLASVSAPRATSATARSPTACFAICRMVPATRPVLPHRTLAGSLFRRYAPYVHCRKHSLLRELLVSRTSLRQNAPPEPFALLTQQVSRAYNNVCPFFYAKTPLLAPPAGERGSVANGDAATERSEEVVLDHSSPPFTIAPFLEPTTCDLGNILKCLRLRDIIN